MNDKISVYTILYYDLQFYEDIIKNIYDIVDEFIIVDGPYNYAVDVLKRFNLYYDETTKPSEITTLLNKYPKIKYTYDIYENEEAKRIKGYNLCSNNIVLLVDTDEFITLDVAKMNDFINTKDKYVRCCKIYNMCDYNINFNPLTEKYILFKKEKISALDHLNYTWLMYCKTGEKIQKYMCFDEVGLIYHQTLCRNKFNNIIKFLFYILVYHKTHNNPLNILDGYDNNTLFKSLSIDEILNIFIHSRLDSINIPLVYDCNILSKIPDENKLIDKLKTYNNHKEFYLSSVMKALKYRPCYFRLNNLNSTTTITFENVKNVYIKLYKIYLNEKYKIQDHNFENINTTITFNNELNGSEQYLVVEINCSETLNNDFIYKIINIS
jgi:hypothetical protein